MKYLMKSNSFAESKRYIKTFENTIADIIDKYDNFLIEVWEIEDDKEEISGYTIWLSKEEIKSLFDKGLIYYDTIDKYAEPLFRVKDRENVEEYLELLRNVNKYNL
jgi:hypothetical protein